MTLKNKTIILAYALAVVFITTFVFQKTQHFYRMFSRGKRYFLKEQYPQAIPYLIAAFNMKPEDFVNLQYLIWSYEKTGNKNELVNLLPLVLKTRRRDADFQEFIADIYYSIRDYAEAESLYRDAFARARGDGYRLKKKLAEVMAWQGKYTESLPILRGLVKKHPEDLSLLEFLAAVHSWSGNYGQAVSIYDKLLIDRIHIYIRNKGRVRGLRETTDKR